MLTREELSKSNIDSETIRCALRQSEIRLHDTLESRVNLDRKLIILFVFNMITVISFISISIITKNNYTHLFYFTLSFSVFSFLSLLFSAFGLRSMLYGTMGTLADFWLRKDSINADKDKLNSLLGLLVLFYDERIKESELSNMKKVFALDSSIISMIVGIIISLSLSVILR